MRSDGDEASVTTTLLLKADRQTPVYSGYELKFTNDKGEESQKRVKHRIEVIPDLPPVVEVLVPKQREVELPINSMLEVETRAADADFQLSRVAFVARLEEGEQFTDLNLLKEPKSGQFITQYEFVPSDHKLKFGDIVEYQIVADDNRVSPRTLNPEPNSVSSPVFRVKLIEPAEGQDARQKTPDQGNSNDENQNEGDSNDSENGSEGDSSDAQSNEAGSEGSESEQEGDGAEGDPQEGEGSESNEPDSQQSDDSGEGNESNDGQSTDGQPNDDQSAEGSEDGDQSKKGADGTGAGDQADPNQPNQQPQEGGEANETSGAGGGDPTTDGSQEKSADGGQTSENGDGQGTRDAQDPGQRQTGQGDGTANRDIAEGSGDDEPVPSDGSNDGEAFEKMQEHIQRKQSESEDGQESDGSPGRNEGNAPVPNDASQDNDANGARDENQTGDERRNGGGSGDQSAQRTEEEQGDGVADATEVAEDQSADPARTTDQAPQDRSSEDKTGEPSRGSSGHEKQPQGDQQEGVDADGTPTEDSPNNDTRDGSRQTEEGQPSNQETNGTSNRNDQNNAAERPSNEQNDAAEQGGKSDQNGEQNADPNAQANESTKTSQTEETPGGLPGHGDRQEMDFPDQEARAGDKANLEFARKQTDLVLDYLKDHPNDTELLDDLGWSKEDLKGFVSRWEQLKQQAVTEPQAQRKLDTTLQSLGLRPQQTSRRVESVQSDAQRQIRQGGNSKPPADYLEQIRAYRRSRARRSN